MVLRYKLYDVISVCFFILGLLMVFMFYSRFADGDIIAFIKSPTLLFIVLSPFIPAAFFSHLSKKKREQVQKMVSGNTPLKG
jgi:zinc transporter ZupT